MRKILLFFSLPFLLWPFSAGAAENICKPEARIKGIHGQSGWVDLREDVIIELGGWQLSLKSLMGSRPPVVEETKMTAGLLLNEIFPNPIGDEKMQEFIELFNPENFEVNLSGWTLSDASKDYSLSGLSVGSGKYLLVRRVESSIALNNGNETVTLTDPFGRVIDSFSYDKSAENLSFNRLSESEWYLGAISPGMINSKPEPENVVSHEGVDDESAGNSIDENLSAIRLNEFLPNPEGSDEAEWIELINPSDESINLFGLEISDLSNSYALPSIDLDAHDYYLIQRADSKISLNNGGDTLLLQMGSDPIDAFSYQESAEEFSWALNENGDWVMTDEPTPESENIISGVEESLVDEEEDAGDPDPSDDGVPGENAQDVATITLDQWPEINDGESVTVSGIISVANGVFNRRIAYMQENSGGSSALELYFHKAEWPELETGQALEIFGEKSITQKGSRLLIRAAEDITLLDTTDWQPFQPSELAGINELENTVVAFTGKLIEQTKYQLIIDVGGGELSSNLKPAAVLLTDLTEGNSLTITGLIKKTTDGVEIRPRSKEDVVMEVDEEPADNEATPVAAISEAPPGGGSSNSSSFLYFALGAVLSLIGYFAVFERKEIVDFVRAQVTKVQTFIASKKKGHILDT